MTAAFSGLGLSLGNLYRLSDAKSRSISPENFTGEPGKGGMATEGTGASCARDLGQGWKISPSIEIAPGEDRLLADIAGPGAIQQIWCVVSNVRWRNLILRIHWDDQEQPSVECPLGDFFAMGWNRFAQISSLAVCVNPGRAFNCYWQMPFREARAHQPREPRSRRAGDPLLPDQLHADRGARGRGLLPRAVPADEPAALQAGLHHPRGRDGAGAVCRHLHGLGRQQRRLVGRRRDQVLHGRRRPSSRPSAAPAPRTISAAPTTSTAA